MSRSTGNTISVPTDEDKVQALYDFWKFIDVINFHGGSQAFGECHRDLIDWYLNDWENQDRSLILMPRGHLKSTLLTVAMCLWRVYQIPDIRIFVGTAVQELAKAFVREIRTYLEDLHLIRHVWNKRPHVEGRLVPEMERTKYKRDKMETEATDRKIIWSTKAIQVVRPGIFKEPTITVGSVGTIPTGFHFDELYLDDVVNFDNIATPEKLARVKSWIDDLICVLDPVYFDDYWAEILPKQATRFCNIGGKINAVGTRYDRNDWYNELLDNEGWAHYQRNIYQNYEDDSDGYLWHEVWNKKVEMTKRGDMTPTRFASQYLNRIIASGEIILDTAKIKYILPTQVTKTGPGYLQITHNDLVATDNGGGIIRPILVVDPAATIGEDSDFTCMCVGGKDRLGNLIIVDARMGKWLAEDILKNMYELLNRWNLNAATIESVGGFAHFVQYVRGNFTRYRPVVLNEYKPVWTQGKKQVRIENALQPLFENGMIYLPSYIAHNFEMKDQLMFFPRKTIHDDFPDTLATLSELAKVPQPKPVNKLQKYKNVVYGGYR